jgi:hypothetical protein
MTLMSVNNHDEQGTGRDPRSQPRWSAGKKTDAVLRLLRGESLEELSRELKVEAHRLAAWRDDFLGGWCSVADSSGDRLSWQTPGALLPDLEDLL